MAATRDDVARLAGVSSSTVSYAISGRRTISTETRLRVERAMAELNYTPNAFARGLAGSRGGILALHYPYGRRGVTSSEFEYVAAATDRARARGYHLLLWSNPIDDVEGLGSLVSEGLVDGVILMELTAHDARVPVLTAARIPFTNIGRPDDARSLWFIDADYEAMGRLAIDHLADLGHERVFFLSQTIGAAERGRVRSSGRRGPSRRPRPTGACRSRRIGRTSRCRAAEPPSTPSTRGRPGRRRCSPSTRRPWPASSRRPPSPGVRSPMM
nr:hypothetical protein GCM10025699_47360 [Microbacterium flavescens]